MLGLGMDQTDKLNQFKGLSQSELFWVLEQLPYATGLFGTDLSYIYYNQAGERMSQIPFAEAVGKTPHDVFPPEVAARFVPLIEQARDSKETVIRELDFDFGNGEIWIQLTYAPLFDDNNEVASIIAITQDITLQKQQEKRLRSYSEHFKDLAEHDALTKLPNRHYFFKLLDETVEQASTQCPLAVMYLDLNFFKEVNDTLGHSYGDELLVMLSGRLSEFAQVHGVTLARIGGDEFALLSTNHQSDDELLALGHQLSEAIRAPYPLSGLQTEVSASIGIAKWPDHGEDANKLMRCADVAMYHAKSHLSEVSIYQEELDNYSLKRFDLVSSFGRALRENELCLYYQPIVEMNGVGVVGFEALLRWQHPEYGLITPIEFITAIENTQTIHELSGWVIDQALGQIKAWSEVGLDHYVSVNLSARNLMDDQISQQVESLIGKHGVDGERLKVEITEHSILMDADRAVNTLTSIGEHGVEVLVDDYGTGYSSLNNLVQLPIGFLKLDMSFVQSMLEQPQSLTIVRSTISMAHSLGLKVVAEGVETQAMWDKLKMLGCDFAQGYFIAKPMPPDAIVDWMRVREACVVNGG